MKEDQCIEYKESWRDDYLKWICGFANANGGSLCIGKNDKGEVTGLSNASLLLETIPNKVRDILGILVDVNLIKSVDKEYLEILVDPYPYPISYQGQYHYRSGSTKQELKGVALDRFLLQKQGRRWDGVPVPRISVADLSEQAFSIFRKKAIKSKRLPGEILDENRDLLLQKLKLLEGGYLKRAAILLFHPDPEMFVTGAYIKVGYFKTDVDLIFQDTIHGPLFEQVEKTMDLLLTKYLKAVISYERINRIETYPFPEGALREALLNAIAHKDYASGNPIQISVYDAKIIIWNEGQLPDNWTIERLIQKHPSVPYNPDIANTFFRSGFIESWGRGTLKIIQECKDAGLPVPEFKYDMSGFIIEFQQPAEESSGKSSGKGSGKGSGKILELIKGNKDITIPELAEKLDISTRAVEKQLRNLQSAEKLARIGPPRGGYWEVIEQTEDKKL